MSLGATVTHSGQSTRCAPLASCGDAGAARPMTAPPVAGHAGA